jgi:tRNA(fMet)-specific endonuclease VapC
VRVALDTNGYVAFCRGEDETVDLLEKADSIHLPFVVLAELRASFAVGSRGSENERVLGVFLSKPEVYSLFADDQTTQQYASVYRQLRQQGTPIPTNDIWIAALALQHGLTLHARDRHFDHLPQLLRR